MEPQSSAAGSAFAPPPILQLAGHPVRWRLLNELARSDRLVRELARAIDEPQNLVSYHLGKLRDGGVVSARRSAADRRDAYYALDLSHVGRLLSTAGGALHPGLRQTPSASREVPEARASVLFLCTGNSARSQMAEALIRSLSGGAVEAFSAGSRPKPLHPNAVRVMAEDYGLDISGQAPKALGALAGQRFDWVVSLCDHVREACPDFPGRPEIIHWSLPNPATGEPDELTYPTFQRTAADLAGRIRFLLHRMAEPETEGGDDVRNP